MLKSGKGKDKLYHNCCGKHMAMLTQCRIMGYDSINYFDPMHPLQQWVREVIGRFCGIEGNNVVLGCDGCGVPVHAITLKNMACAFERLATSNFQDEEYKRVCSIICSSMMEYPYLIAGEGRFDYQLMEALKGKAIAKTGAEGVLFIGLPEIKLGIALKLTDGSHRGIECIITRVMEIIGCLNAEDREKTSHFREIYMHNHRSNVVGKIFSAF